MRWNPYMNGIGAVAYVWAIGSFLNYMTALHSNTPDTFVTPIAALSLFTFSVAVMAFLFFYRPIALLIEGKKEEAVLFFVKTLGVFGIITLLVVLTIL